MQINTFLLELVKFTLAGIGTVYVAFYLIKPYLERSEKLQLMELKKSTTALTLPLRFQAYERLIVFVERVNPANMLIRLHGTQYSAHELHSLVVSEIREEFQHNVSQQIYVSERAWNVIKRVKDDTMSVITNAIKALPENATGLELSKTVLAHMASLQDNPYDIATSMIRKDMEELM
ncbi:MAG TPA: hypothetical protein VJ844_00160 [Mucilaginibacter sp.]|nr:hypothetical protein [Mucilaginibacter sp.]